MSIRARRERRSKETVRGFALSSGTVRRTVLLTAITLVTLGATASGAAASLSVYVGYADTLRAKATHFPTPWAPAVKVYGNNCMKHTCDNGTVRLVNNGKTAVKVKSVVVKLSKCTFDAWPHNLKIGPGKQVILGNEGRKGMSGCPKKLAGFDTSEIGPHGSFWNGHCNQSGVIPVVDITTATGTTKLKDTGQVLNTDGIDKARCPKTSNESLQWTLIGSQPCPTASLTLAPPTQTHKVGTKAAVTARLTNSGGKGCGKPLSGAKVTFKVLSGPNKGKTGSGVTNKSGKARFTYKSSKTGTDTLRAGAKNPVGTISSNKVKVIWTKAVHKHRAGTFSCEGLGANVLGMLLADANHKNSPCVNAHNKLVKIGPIPVAEISARAVTGRTHIKAGKLPKAGDTATAQAKVAHATVGGVPMHNIVIGAVTSQATEQCVSKGGKLTLSRSANSRVAFIIVNGKKTIIGNKYMKISLGPLATIYLNRTIKTGNSLTRRAVEIDLLGKVLVILAQSEVDFTGNPCATA